MCIILACKPGHRPSDDVISTCWDNNPDGAGVAWAQGGRVEIAKGLMSLSELRAALRYVPDASPLVVHMRIGTSGGYGAEVTHPYPVTSDLGALHALDIECGCAIAHNGVLPYPTDDAAGVSDTVYYVGHVVSKIARSRAVRRHGGLAVSRSAYTRLAKTSRGSRLCILDGAGNMRLIGDGWQGVARGVEASNSSWRASRWVGLRSWYGCSLYGDEDDGSFFGCPEYEDYAGCAGCDGLDGCLRYGPMCFEANKL